MAARPYGSLSIIGAVLMIVGVLMLGFGIIGYLREAVLGLAAYAGFIILFAGFLLFSFSRKQRS